MPVYKWRRRPTKHFGEVWVPLAQFVLRGRDNTSHSIAAQIDSGATISLLRKSTADLLGIELESGRKIDLSGVGSGKIDAFVHAVPTSFEQGLADVPIPYAIATTEAVPNLLGRIGVFELLQVDFDPSLNESQIRARWLDDGDRQVWNWLIETQEHVYARLPKLGWSDEAREACRRFLNRADMVVAAIAGLAKQQRMHTCPLLIRSMFEVSAQFQYLMQDRDSRARDYLDFEHITRKLEVEAALAGPKGPLCDHIRNSPLRVGGMARVNAEFARVEARYRNKKGSPHKNWYCIQFAQLVERLDTSNYPWVAEHGIWYSKYSAWAHGDSFSTSHDHPNDPLQPRDWLIMSYGYLARMLLRIADDGMIILTGEQDSGLRRVAKGLLSG